MKSLLVLIAEVLCLPLLLLTRPKRRAVDRVLVIEPWGIGDFVLCTGALEDISRHWPNAEVSVLARSYAETILRYQESDIKAICAEFPWTVSLTGKYKLWRWPWRTIFGLLKRLRKERFDVVVECRGDVRNHIIMAVTGAGIRVGLSSVAGLLLTNKPDSKPLLGHRINDWQKVSSILGIVQRSVPRLSVTEQAKADISRRLKIDNRDWLGIHMGAKNAAKRWPFENFEQVLKVLSKREGVGPIVLFEEPGDDFAVADLPDGVFLAKNISLDELIAAIANCNKFICCDGGAMHIAAALGVPVVAMFGPTNRDWFGPVGAQHTVIQKDVCQFRPCFDMCKYPSPICMEAISVKDMLKSIE